MHNNLRNRTYNSNIFRPRINFKLFCELSTHVAIFYHLNIRYYEHSYKDEQLR